MSTQLTVQLAGGDQQNVKLSKEIFGREVSKESIYYALNAERANLRQGNAATKTRGHVRGSNIKPWRQKGTGRARAGSRQSPLWVGGGTIFGPHPKDYSINIPPKQKRAALMSLLSFHNAQNNILAIDQLNVANGKTKELVTILTQKFKEINFAKDKILLIIDDEHEQAGLVRRAGKNIPGLRINSYNRMAAITLVYVDYIIFALPALEKLQKKLGSVKTPAKPSAKPSVKPPAETAKDGA